MLISLAIQLTRPGSGRRFEVACEVAFLLRNTVYEAGPCFRPGRAAFKAIGPGRVLGQTVNWRHRPLRNYHSANFHILVIRDYKNDIWTLAT